jgi:hypothetical protein
MSAEFCTTMCGGQRKENDGCIITSAKRRYLNV